MFQLICAGLKADYSLKVTRSCVLDLEARSDAKLVSPCERPKFIAGH